MNTEHSFFSTYKTDGGKTYLFKSKLNSDSAA
jgi:hypothetical protein